ncbi:MAG: thiamine-phosphate kinase [Candidatus Eiseniibacteriota bacterium]
MRHSVRPPGRRRAKPERPGELELIRRLTSRLAHARGTVIGPGDDAAVVRPTAGRDLVVTTDAFVEGVHFRSEWARIRGIGPRLPSMIGARLASANVSDLAAMGARPRWAVLSTGVGRRGAQWFERVQRSLAGALERSGASLVGGNLCRAAGRDWLSLTLIGEVRRGYAIARSGARAGDWIAITGSPGRAAAFEALADAGRSDRVLERAWSRPPARVAFAGALASRGLVHAAIDVSDGVAGDLSQLCRASGVSAELAESAWPADAAIERALAMLESRAARTAGRNVAARRLGIQLGASDDYELILAVPPLGRARCEALARVHRTPLEFVGRFSRGTPGALWLRTARGRRRLRARGYDHLASGQR